MESKELTIVIVTYKSKTRIQNCLRSIPEEIPVIVVENSNDQLLKEEILSRYNNVDCVLSKENLGYGAGNNLGLSKVETNYALIVNPDVTLKNDAIKQFFLRINKVENFGIIAPVSKDEKYNNFNIDFDKDIKEVENVKGFAMFLNMKNLKKINFFDENNIIGTLKLQGRKNIFKPDNDIEENYWFSLNRDDILKFTGKEFSKYIIYLDGNYQFPKPKKITANISNNHKKYAITWFSLAISILLLYLYFRKKNY